MQFSTQTCRQEAKENGDFAMAYVYKIMNTLYGRFGINPAITEVCKKNNDSVI